MGDYIIPFGKKYRGKKISEIPRDDLQSYIEWLESSDIRPGTLIHTQTQELKKAFSELAKTQEPAEDRPAGRKKNVNKNDPYRGANVQGNIMRLFLTGKGDELPLINFKGKEYLEVKYRLVWFRSEHPGWTIETEFVNVTENSSFAKATIRDETGRVLATSHKLENKLGFSDFVEKSETGAIGRALALLGFGTQFCADELDEGERIVDAPSGQGHPSEPEVPTVENGPVIAVTIEGRNKEKEVFIRKLGFIFDWVSHRYLNYYDKTDIAALDDSGLDYEILEKSVFRT